MKTQRNHISIVINTDSNLSFCTAVYKSTTETKEQAIDSAKQKARELIVCLKQYKPSSIQIRDILTGQQILFKEL